eukprot:UN24899
MFSIRFASRIRCTTQNTANVDFKTFSKFSILSHFILDFRISKHLSKLSRFNIVCILSLTRLKFLPNAFLKLRKVSSKCVFELRKINDFASKYRLKFRCKIVNF